MSAPPPPAPATDKVRATVKLIVPADYSGTLLSLLDELTEDLTAVRDRIVVSNKFTFDVVPTGVIAVNETIDYFNTTDYSGRVAGVLGAQPYPTIGYVVGVSHTYAASGWPTNPYVAIGGALQRPTRRNVMMHELGHLYTNSTGHPLIGPRKVNSWFGFGTPTYYYDVMSYWSKVYETMPVWIDQYGNQRQDYVAAYQEPLESLEFSLGLDSTFRLCPFLRKVT